MPKQFGIILKGKNGDFLHTLSTTYVTCGSMEEAYNSASKLLKLINNDINAPINNTVAIVSIRELHQNIDDKPTL